MPNLNPNSTNYIHSYEPNTNDLTLAMDYDALGRPLLRTGIASRDVPSANSAFGEPVTAQLLPVVQIESIFGLDPDEIQTYTGGGGTTTPTHSVWTAASTSTLGSYAVLRSRRVVRYRPGQGALARFTAMFDAKEGTSLRVGFGNQQEALQIGFNGTRFGILHRYGAHAEIRTLTITGTSSAGTATITLNDTAFQVTLVNGETATQTAARIARATFTGWLVEQKDNDVRFVNERTLPLTGTFSYVGAGGTTGVFTTNQTGEVGTENWIYQEDFNIDTLDGNGASGVTIDFTKLNVFSINFRWLGAGISQFAVEHPDTGAMMFFHKIHWTNRNTRPWCDDPGFKLTYTAYNIGGSEAASISGASMAGFVEGVLTRNNYTRSYSLQKSSLASNTVHHIFSMKNPLVYNGSLNTKEIVIQDVSIATQGNDPVQVYVFFNAALATGNHIYNRLPEAAAVISTETGTINLANYTAVASFIVGLNGSQQYDLTPYRIVIPAGQTVTLAVRSGQSISQLSAAMVWLAD